MDSSPLQLLATLFLSSLAALIVGGGSFHAHAHDGPGPRRGSPVTILQMNDVYSTQPVDGGTAGGLARVATLAKQLREEGRTVMVMLSGDFLSPSVASSVFEGREMIETLNTVPLDFVTLGNHEFDFGVPILLERMKEAKFEWIIANILDERTGKPIGGAKPYVVRQCGPIKVGILGLCLIGAEIMEEKRKGAIFKDPFETAGEIIPKMKSEGAEVIVAMTHFEYGDDVKLARQFPDIDLILGGHEHHAITSFVGSTLISKADSDARTVARHDLKRAAPGAPVERHFELVRIDKSLEDAPEVAKAVARFEAELDSALAKPVGKTEVPLNAVAEDLRTREVNLGNFFTDAMRAATGADIAIMNSGSIRSNMVYPAGPLTRRDLLAMHPFGGTATKVELDGATILEALTNGFSLIGQTAGRFPQVSGLEILVDPKLPVEKRVTRVTVQGKPLEPDKTYVVSINDYMLGGGDGYGMFSKTKVLLNAEASPLLISVLEKRVLEKIAIAPQVEGRIRFAGVEVPLAAQKTPVILDTDMGADSVLGMLYMLKSPRIDLRAVTVVNGIAHVDAGVENALKILALTGDGAIPVAAGQSAPLEGMRAFPEFWRVQANTLGSGETRTRLPDSGAEPYKGTAEDLIIEKLKASKIPITIIAMGPLTNVALALKKDPDIAPKIRKIIAMGGAIKVLGNVDQPFVGIDNSAAEWNFYIDPHAAEAVIKSGVSVVLVPLDATKNLPISPAFVQKVRESPRDATSELLLSLLTSIEDGVEGGWFFFWDTLAAVAATRSEIMATYPARIEIVLENGPSLGQTKSVETGGMEVRVSEEVNREAFEKDFLEVVLDR